MFITTLCVYTVRPVVAIDVSAVSITGSSAVILWTIPYIELTSELYTVIYGINPDALDQSSNQIPSYADTTLTNQTYSTTLNGLQPLTTYYYQIRSQNTEAFSTTAILQFTTTEGRKGTIIDYTIVQWAGKL